MMRLTSEVRESQTPDSFEMTEEDFYMAITGCASALKKLDKTRMLELKYFKRRTH